MSRNRDRWDVRRAAVLLLAVAQLLVPIGLQVLDAVLEGHEFDTPLHVEGEGREACGGGHTHLVCQTARSMSTGLLATDVARTLVLFVPEFVEDEDPDPSIGRSTDVSGALGSRAPPLA